MSEEKPRKIVTGSRSGVFQDLAKRIKLIIRLMADPRVNSLLKLLPIGSLLYLLFPDLAPGPIDDAAIIWLSTYLFVELCPPEVVREHMDALDRVIPGEWQDASVADDEVVEGEIIEGEFEEE